MVSADSSSGQMTLKFEGDASGNIKYTVVRPLSKQGIVMVDDGRVVTHYYPDEELIVRKSSPRAGLLSPKRRAQLATQNYQLSVQKGPKVAARGTVRLEAKPKSSGLPRRIFLIDAEEGVLLRSETISGETISVLLDTHAIQYGADADVSMRPDFGTENWRVVTERAPALISNLTIAAKNAGIDFKLPQPIPYGLVIQGIHMKEDRGKSAVLLRLTDGLASVSMYVAKARAGQASPGLPSNAVGNTFGDMSLVVVSDLPKKVNQSLVDAVIKVNTRTK